MPAKLTNPVRTKLMASIVTAVIIAGFVILTDQLNNQNSHTNTTSTQTSPTVSTVTPNSTSTSNTNTTHASSGNYIDGTYTATSGYYVPHGQESIQVDLTLKDGVIAAVSIQNSKGDGDSAAYQGDFESVYKSHVVGKKISGLKLGTISGASDTTSGFNDALNQIVSKAQA